MLKEDIDHERDEIASGKPKKKAFLEHLLEVHLKDSSFTEENIREEVDTFMFEVILISFYPYYLLKLRIEKNSLKEFLYLVCSDKKNYTSKF